MNTNGDRIVLLESTDGEIRITATEQRIFIVTPFNAAFKDELKARFGARWNGSTREWSIALRYRDALDPLLYAYFGVSMIADVTTPSLMKVSIDAYGLYRASGAGSEITLAGSRVAVRWGRDESVKVYRGVFKKDGEDFRFPRSGGSMRRPRVAGCGELDGATLETDITPAELDWLRENDIDFELLDGGESSEPQPEDTQLDPEDMNGLHEDDDTWMEDDDDEYRVYVQQEEDNKTEAEAEVENESDEDKDKEEQEMNSCYHVKADEPSACKAQDKGCQFCEGTKHFTNAKVVKAWETFAKRAAYVASVDRDIEPEAGYRRIWNTGGCGLVVWGAEYRLRHESLDAIEEAIDEALDKVKDYLGEQTFFLEGHLWFVTREWNGLMDAIAHDESASPEVRQAAEDASIIAFGYQDGKTEYIELFKPADDGWVAKKHHVMGWHSPDIFTTYPTTEHGVHMASYLGWDGDAEVVNAGGWVDGVYYPSSEVEQAGLWDRLSEEVKSEMEPLAGGDPAEWNDKILELELSGRVSHEDEELLDALWILGEVFGGSVAVYGTDADVTKMDYEDFRSLGLHRLDYDDEDEDEDEDEVDIF